MITFAHTPEDYIINMSVVEPTFGYTENDIMISALKIRNSSESAIEIYKIRFEIQSENKIMRATEFVDEELIGKFNELFQYTPFEEKFPGGLVAYFGVDQFWKLDQYTGTLKLNPNQETGLCFEHFRFISKNLADNIKITIFFQVNGESNFETYEIPLRQYHPKNEYIFPLKGTWIVNGTYHSLYGHRRSSSQEFGWDAIRFGEDLQPYPNGTKNEDVAYFESEVYAIADGKVVDCYGNVPNNPNQGKKLLEDPAMAGQLAQEHGIPTFALGNFVHVEHANGEFSFYAHFSPHTLKVKKGDTVKQGQVIGLMGNSGNSNAVHLHFHLSSGADPFVGRGFPSIFNNIHNCWNQPISLFENEYQVVYENDNS